MLWSAGVIRGIGLILTMKHCFDLTEGYYAAYFAGVYEATKLVFFEESSVAHFSFFPLGVR